MVILKPYCIHGINISRLLHVVKGKIQSFRDVDYYQPAVIDFA